MTNTESELSLRMARFVLGVFCCVSLFCYGEARDILYLCASLKFTCFKNEYIAFRLRRPGMRHCMETGAKRRMCPPVYCAGKCRYRCLRNQCCPVPYRL